ncbi:zinc-binding dehydrogenase [Pseudonocardia xinjiangensis]|uniref:zinc-binding dehydrogenase n=1 Tax=Pseudonocardia xinjiangensis TaxID=75289 RepID=UPI001B7D0F49|nr:zinc-binding dehydrogenase [Pseudonocardia xinjiangensis]
MFLSAGLLETTAADLHGSSAAQVAWPHALAIDDPVLAAVIGGLGDSALAGAEPVYAETAAAYLLAHLLTRHGSLPAPWPVRGEDVRVRRAISFINDNHHLPLPLNDIAAAANLSPFDFLRVFKLATGQTPHRFLNRPEVLVKIITCGVCRVAVISRSNRRETAAREMGAERFVATDDSDPAEALRAWDGGADLILNASPSTSAAAATLTGLAPDGTLVLCGYGSEPLSLPTESMALNRLHVMANPSGSPHDTRDTLAFSTAHGILPEFTPIGLRDANAVLDAMAKGDSGKRSVITFD